jgi:hypothetical protein
MEAAHGEGVGKAHREDSKGGEKPDPKATEGREGQGCERVQKTVEVMGK